MKCFFISFFRDENAPTFLEYGLLVTLIAVAAFGSVTLFGDLVLKLFQDTNSAIAGN